MFPLPRRGLEAPRTEILQIVSRESINLDRLACGVIAFGENIGKLQLWTDLEPQKIRDLLTSRELKEKLTHLVNNPETVLPSRAHLYALLLAEAEMAPSSRDRQNAIGTLLTIVSQEKPSEEKAFDTYIRPAPNETLPCTK